MPKVFKSLASRGDPRWSQVNDNFRRLDRESIVKQFGKSGSSNMVVGMYDGEHFGIVFYDSSGIPVQLVGQAPDDGRMGNWTAKPGENVMTLLGV